MIVASTLVLGAQATPKPDRTPLSLFPVQTLWTLSLNNQLTVPPAYDDARGYFAIAGDRLVAYDLARGAQLWVATARPQIEPTTGDGLLFVVEPDALKALATSDGHLAWQLAFSEKLAVRPVWDNGWLVLATREGSVLAFRARDGHLIWRRDIGSSADGQPALAADRIYVPLSDGRIIALRVDSGEPLWEHRLGGPPTDMLPLDDRLYVGSRDNYLYCLNTSDGKIEWRWRTGGDVVGVPVVDDENVYFVSFDNVLRALSRTSGSQRWMRALPLRPTQGPLQAGAVLVVTGVAPTLRAYNIKDGTPAGDLATGGELAARPYLVPTSPGLPPRLLVVTRDIAKGATALLLGRRIEPSIEPLAPLPAPVLPLIEPPAPVPTPVLPDVGR